MYVFAYADFNMLCLGIAILISYFAIGIADEQQKTVVLNTPQGSIRGLEVVVPETGDIVHEFRGIRYGKPTSGERRFKKPEPFGKWEGERDGTKFSAACPQPAITLGDYEPPEISEDCLALNIYVPTSRKKNQKLAVMVWIHGGGMLFGHSHQYDGKGIAAAGNVIVVTINYRMGIFGFLALDHPAAKGNYILWDQKLALQWVHDNIAAFDGNPELVTIFGESSGGWSVNVQSLIPSNKGLFKRVIAQSGSFDLGRMEMPKRNELHENAQKIGTKTNCTFDENEIEEFVNCLRTKTIEELVEASNSIAYDQIKDYKISVKMMTPSTVIDGELLKGNPFKLLKDVNSEVARFFKSIEFIAGTTSQEGALETANSFSALQEHYGFNITEGLPAKFLCEAYITPYVEDIFNGDDEIRSKLCNFCTAESKDEESLKAVALYGDLVLANPVIRMLDFHASLGGKTWQYVFSKPSPILLKGPLPKWCKGAAHFDDVLFMFPYQPLAGERNVTFTDEETGLSKKLIQYFTSFAKTGIPQGGENTVEWNEFTCDGREYIDFDTPIKLRSNWEPDRVKLWREVIGKWEEKENVHTEL